MRAVVPIFISLAFSVCCQAQSSVNLAAYSESSGTVERINSNLSKAIGAVNANAAGKPIKDPTLESQFSGKAFNGGGQIAESGKSGEMAPFLYEQKVGAGEYKTQKSFFGIKNPWFGKDVHEVREAPLLSGNGFQTDKSFASTEVDTRAVPDGDRAAFSDKGDVPTRTYTGKTEGEVTQFGEQLQRKMDIEEVRELLNKNR